jgi:hypothetical protein
MPHPVFATTAVGLVSVASVLCGSCGQVDVPLKVAAAEVEAWPVVTPADYRLGDFDPLPPNSARLRWVGSGPEVDGSRGGGVAARRLGFAAARLGAVSVAAMVRRSELDRAMGAEADPTWERQVSIGTADGSSSRQEHEVGIDLVTARFSHPATAEVIDSAEQWSDQRVFTVHVLLDPGGPATDDINLALRGRPIELRAGQPLGLQVAEWPLESLLRWHGWRGMVDEDGYSVIVAFGQSAAADGSPDAAALAAADARAVAATEIRDVVEWFRGSSTRPRFSDWYGRHISFFRLFQQGDESGSLAEESMSVQTTRSPFAMESFEYVSTNDAVDRSRIATPLEEVSSEWMSSGGKEWSSSVYKLNDPAWAEARAFSERMSPMRVLREWRVTDGRTGERVVGVVLAVRMRDLVESVRRGDGGR